MALAANFKLARQAIRIVSVISRSDVSEYFLDYPVSVDINDIVFVSVIRFRYPFYCLYPEKIVDICITVKINVHICSVERTDE